MLTEKPLYHPSIVPSSHPLSAVVHLRRFERAARPASTWSGRSLHAARPTRNLSTLPARPPNMTKVYSALDKHIAAQANGHPNGISQTVARNCPFSLSPECSSKINVYSSRRKLSKHVFFSFSIGLFYWKGKLWQFGSTGFQLRRKAQLVSVFLRSLSFKNVSNVCFSNDDSKALPQLSSVQFNLQRKSSL